MSEKIENKLTDIPLVLFVASAILWFFQAFMLVNAQPFRINYPQMISVSICVVGIVLSAVLVSSRSNKINRKIFIEKWILGGLAISFLPALYVFSKSIYVVLAVSGVIGVFFGLGAPILLGYFASATKDNNRSTISGAAFLIILLCFNLFSLISSILIELIILFSLMLVAFLSFRITKPPEVYSGYQGLPWRKIPADKPFLFYLLSMAMLMVGIFLVMPANIVLFASKNNEIAFLIMGGFAGGSAIICGYLGDLYGRKKLLFFGFFLAALSYSTLSIFPLSTLSYYVRLILYASSLGILYPIFIFVLWGDLSKRKSPEKYYTLGCLPFLIAVALEYSIGTSMVPFLSPVSLFSFVSIFLFAAILPLAYATEVLPSRNKINELNAVLLSDITERKKAEKEVEVSKRRLDDILNSVAEPLMAVDFNWNILFVNNAEQFTSTAKAAGLKRAEEMVGKNLWALAPGHFGSKLEENYRAAMEKREIRNFESFATYSGRWNEVIVYPSAEGITIFWRDITERKKAEEALRESERMSEVAYEHQRLLSILENLPAMVCLIKTDHHIAFVNRLFREKYGEPEGKPCHAYFEGKERPCEFCEAFQVIKTGKPHHWVVNTQDGFVIDAYDYPFADVDGSSMVLEVNFDITERINLEKQLQAKERLAAIGATAGMVGHDIRNPLQSIAGDAYLLKNCLTSISDSEAREEVEESLDNIETNISYINKIVLDLQDYARPLVPDYKKINMSNILTDALRAIQVPDNIEISFNYEKCLELRTDAEFIRRALTNLVSNAIQAMPDGGKLSVNATMEKGKITIIVEDSGIGIPDDIKPKLFTPMMTTKAKGQGLGLAVVKRLVEALNGTINFESQAGKGTKFMVELPLAVNSEN